MKLPLIDMSKTGNVLLIIGCVLFVTYCQPVKEVAVIPEGWISPTEQQYQKDVLKQAEKIKNQENEINKLNKRIKDRTAFIINSTRVQRDSMRQSINPR